MASTETDNYKRMTEAPIAPLIVRLAIPTTLTMLVTNIYNLVDTAFVGRLGTSASGAVGIVFGFMSIIQAFGFLFGQGAGSIIARRLGQKNNGEANVVASTSVVLSFSVGALLALLTELFLEPLIVLMGSTPTIMPFAKDYIRFILVATPFMTAGFTMNQILRYEGRAALGMVGMVTGCVLNILGDALFMFVLDMGISGAGLSTALSEVVSFSILLTMFLSGRSISRLSIKSFSPDLVRIADIAGTGLPSLLRQALNALATMLLNNQAAVYGDAAVAAMSIVGRIIFFAFSVALGIGQGFQPVGAFNYGAGKYGRVRKGYRSTLIIGEACMLVAAAALLAAPEALMVLFRDDPEVVVIGAFALRLQALSLLLMPPTVVTEMLYQTTGHKLGASALSLMRGGLIFIPLILILPQVIGLLGVQMAQAVANAAAVVPAVLFAAHFFRNLPEEAPAREATPGR